LGFFQFDTDRHKHVSVLSCRQARQEFGAVGNGGGGGMAGMGFDAPSPSGLQLAGQLSPLQESTFTPHRTQPKHNLRQMLGNTGFELTSRRT